MADTKISNFTAGTPAQATDMLAAARGAGNVKLPVSDFATAAQGTKADGAAQIAGDLGGTAATPVVAKINGIAVTGTPSVGQVPTATSASAASWQTPAGSGTVTATAGALTSNALVLGAGTTDTKVSTGLTTNGVGEISLGVAGTTAGAVNFAGSTSGNTRLRAPAVAVTGDVLLPSAAGTLARLEANTFTGSHTIASGTKTASEAIVSGTQTWNNAAVTFDAYLINITDTASATGSFLLRLQTSGVDRFKVTKDGGITTANGLIAAASLQTASNVIITAVGAAKGFVNQNDLGYVSLGAASDSILTRPAAAAWQYGAANAAAPVAYTVQGQGARAGTDTNVGGANFTQQPGTGTGTGTLSSLIFKSPKLGASGTAAQTQELSLTIVDGVAVRAKKVVSGLPTASTALEGGMAWVTDATLGMIAGYGTNVVGGGSSSVPVSCNGTNWVIG